jgi:hypothetical protein
LLCEAVRVRLVFVEVGQRFFFAAFVASFHRGSPRLGELQPV